MPMNQYHARYLEILFDRSRLDGHPSPMMLQRLESAITDREAAELYAEALLDNIDSRRYPSPQLLARAHRVITLLAVADRMEQQLARAA